MNAMFLPDKIKKALAAAGVSTPAAALRAAADLNGGTGECYVVAADNGLTFFNREVGKQDFEATHAAFAELGAVALREDKFNFFLDCALPGKPLSLKFSSFDKRDLNGLLELVKSKAGVVPPPPSPVPGAGPGAPAHIAFAAALMFTAKSDQSVDPHEDAYIRNVCMDKREILVPALELFRKSAPESLASSMGGFSRDQKLCVIANMLDLAMADGSLSSAEQKTIRKFVEGMGVTEDDYQALRDVLLLKNNLSVLA